MFLKHTRYDRPLLNMSAITIFKYEHYRYHDFKYEHYHYHKYEPYYNLKYERYHDF